MADVTLQIAADITKGLSSIEKFRGDTQKSLSSIERGFQGLKTVAAAAVGIFAGQQILKGINATIAAASRQQDAVNQLNTALKLSGEFTEEASQELQNFASALQATSTVGDEAVLESLALAKAFGATNEQARLVTEAAIELSAATGKSLEESTRQVSKTLGGFAGELGEVNPAIKALTAEQLRAGEAARILISQYGGSAQAQLQTFSGAQKALNNAYGDTLEAIGNIVVENKALVGALNIGQQAFQEITRFITANNGEFEQLVTKLAEVSQQAIPALVTGFKSAVSIVSALIGPTLSVVNAITLVTQKTTDALLVLVIGLENRFLTVFSTIAGGAQRLGKVFGVSFGGLDSTVDSLNSRLAESNTKVDAAVSQFLDFSSVTKDLNKAIQTNEGNVKNATSATRSFEKSTKDLTASQKELQAQAQKTLSEVAKIAGENEQLRLSIDKIGKTTDQVAVIEFQYQSDKIDAQIQSLDLNNEENRKLKEQLEIKKDLLAIQLDLSRQPRDKPKDGRDEQGNDQLDQAIQSPFAKAAAIFSEGLTISQNFFKSIGSAFDNAANIFNDVVGGGIISNFSGIASSIVNIPSVLGGVFNSVDELFSKNVGGQIINMVDGFGEAFANVVNKIPDVFAKLGEVVETIFPTIIDSLPDIVSKLANGIGDLAIIFAEKIIPQLIRSIPKVVDALLRALPRIITALLNSLPGIFKAIAQALPELVNVLVENLTPITVALVEGIVTNIPLIVSTLIDELILKGGIFRIAFALAKALIIDLPIAIARGILRGLANLGDVVFSQLANIFSNGISFPELRVPDLSIPTPGWLDRLQAIFDSFDPGRIFGGFGGGGGGGRGPITGIKGSPLALGGTIPQGFPNDTFPARLTSGEEVISKDRAERLDRFMAEGMANKNVTVNLQVGEAELASVIFNLNQRGFRLA